MKSQKNISLLLFLLITAQLFAQNENNYELVEAKSDALYYNFVTYNNINYIGSNLGMLEINNKEIKVKDPDLKGYISIVKGKIYGNNMSMNYDLFDTKFNYLLPIKYQTKQTTNLVIDNRLYIVSKGVLFIFKKLNYELTHDSLSVRSISKNIIGSYSGIYINGNKIPYPIYTDGTIKEYGDEKFICYGGLLYINGKKTVDFRSKASGEFEIYNNHYGLIRDVFKIKQNVFVAVTNKGIFKFNLFNNSKVDTVYLNKTLNELNGIFYIEGEERIFYHTEDKIYYYSISEKKNFLYLDTKFKKPIKDIYAKNLTNLYVLFDDSFYYFNANSSSIFTYEILISGINQSHNVQLFKNIFCISTNLGIHFYNQNSNKAYLNVINIETNRRSLSIINDSLQVGTPNGIIHISENNLNDILKEIDITPLIPKINNYQKIIFFISILLFISIIFIIVLLIKRKKQPSLNVIDNSVTKENIIKFIHENITNVSIISICDKFGINTVRLYEILEDEKPGEIIRNHRLNLVRRYRRERKDDTFIAKNTGFSVSYLKKIY